MNFVIERNLTDKVFSTKVKFSSYGYDNLTEAEEKDLIADFGAPVLDLGKITFTGTYGVDGNKRVIEDASGDTVEFILNSKKLDIKDGFEVNMTVDSKKLFENDLTDLLNTKELLAEAKCLLFEKKIKEALEEKMVELRGKQTMFENPEERLEFKA